jgi:hypothetical protein
MDPYLMQADPMLGPPPMMQGLAPPIPPGMPMPPMGGMGMDPMMMGMPPMDPMMGMPPPGPMEQMAPVPPPVEEFVPPGPQSLPVNYVPPPKPKLDDILEEAEQERQDHTERIELAMLTQQYLNLERTGVLHKNHIEDIKSGRMLKGRLTDLRDEHDAYVAHIASMDWSCNIPLKDSIDKEETIAKEDAAHYFFECFQRQHSNAGNGSLKAAIPDTLGKYGMLAASLVIDPLNDECGLRFQMLDPATVFPVFEGGMGLARVYRVYQATASQVIGSFFDATGTLAKKVKKEASADKRYDPHYMGEVTEYWDKEWVMVAWEGKELLCRRHGYCKVPIKIKYGSFGMQGFTQTSHLVDGDGVIRHAFGANRSHDVRRRDLKRIAQPFLARRFEAHDIEEGIMGVFNTAMMRQLEPPTRQYLNLQSQNEGSIKAKQGQGETTVLRDDDKMEDAPPVFTPDVVNAVMANLTQNKQTGMASGVIMGQMPGGQTNGSAIDILGQAGTEKFRPLVTTEEEWLTELIEWAFELVRDWGPILGMEGNLGVVEIPRRNPNPRTGEAPAHELTPEVLRRVGIRASVTLRRFNPNNLTQLINGLGVMYNMGAIDIRGIIDTVGITNNPDAMIDRIDDEKLDQVPEVLQEKTLRRLYKQAEIAEKRGDMESARENMNRAYFIASQMQHRMMYGQPTDPATGMPLPAPGTPAGNQVEVQSDPALSGMPGAQGGRPPGSAGGDQVRAGGPMLGT